MNRARFRQRFNALDAVAVETLWHLYLETRDIPGARGEIVLALERLEAQVEAQQFGARRPTVPPPPVAVPPLEPVS